MAHRPVVRTRSPSAPPRPRFGLVCRRNATPASPRGSSPPLLAVPAAGNDMSVTAAPPGCLAGGTGGRIHRPEVSKQPLQAGNRPIQCPGCSAVRVRFSGVLSHGGDSRAYQDGRYRWRCEDGSRTRLEMPHRGPGNSVCKGCQNKRYRCLGGDALRERNRYRMRLRRMHPRGARQEGAIAGPEQRYFPFRRPARPAGERGWLIDGSRHTADRCRPSSPVPPWTALPRAAPSGPWRKPNGPQFSSRYRLGRERSGARSGSPSHGWNDRPPLRR